MGSMPFKNLIKYALSPALSNKMKAEGRAVFSLSLLCPYLSSGYYGVEPYYDATKEAVTPYPLDRVLVATEFASRATGLGQPSLEALGVHQGHRTSASIERH